MRFLVMFVTAVCMLFLIKLRWPKKNNFHPFNAWFITVTAFKSVGLLRNNYFKISSNPPSNLLHNVLNFYSLRQFFMFSEWYCIKRLSSSTLCSFFIILRCNSDFWTVFRRGLFSPWFGCLGRKKFAARYFWFKANLKQKKFIFK